MGVNYRGRYRFNGAQTGNAFSDFFWAAERRGISSTNRGPLDGHSNDFATFVQDDWKVNRSLTVFLGCVTRSSATGTRRTTCSPTSSSTDGGHHVVPNAEVAAKLPPGVIALDRTLLASDSGVSDALINTDKNNFSPRVGFAWRLDESNKTVFRGGFGSFHPTVAVQGVRDLLATNEFRYITTRRGDHTATRFLDRRTRGRPRGLRQRRYRPQYPRAPTSTSTTSRSSESCPAISACV